MHLHGYISTSVALHFILWLWPFGGVATPWTPPLDPPLIHTQTCLTISDMSVGHSPWWHGVQLNRDRVECQAQGCGVHVSLCVGLHCWYSGDQNQPHNAWHCETTEWTYYVHSVVSSSHDHSPLPHKTVQSHSILVNETESTCICTSNHSTVPSGSNILYSTDTQLQLTD